MFMNCVQAIDTLTNIDKNNYSRSGVLERLLVVEEIPREKNKGRCLYAKAPKRDFSDGITELSVRKESFTDMQMIYSNIINGLARWPLW